MMSRGVANLVPNAEVKVADVTAGSVKAIDFDNWQAKLTVGLERNVELPANAIAKIGQKSLLGAEYVEITPPVAEPPVGLLRNGDVIPASRTGRYPETEELLGALSLLLNNGGLSQVQTITTEINKTLGGHEGDVKSLIGNLDKFVGALNGQRNAMIQTSENLNRLGVSLGDQREVIQHGLDTIPQGLALIADDRDQLVTTLNTLGTLGVTTKRTFGEVRSDLIANINNLVPVLTNLSNAGRNLTESLATLAFPFPGRTSVPALMKGDYGNLYATVDLDINTLYRNQLTGFTLPGLPNNILSRSFLGKFPQLQAGQPPNMNPLTLPFEGVPAKPNVAPVPGSGDQPGLSWPLPAAGTEPGEPPSSGENPLGGLLRGGVR
jgi:phospholipid/cholesterol/gamma-HCH transport system substrate-binding protein